MVPVTGALRVTVIESETEDDHDKIENVNLFKPPTLKYVGSNLNVVEYVEYDT